MFFKRKCNNRRRPRERVLAVKLRSAQRRQIRLRRITLAVGLCAGVFFGLFAVWRGGEWLLRRFVYENPAFAIHQLDVQNDGRIALEQLRRWAGVKLEENLLALDLARVKRDLEMVPAIGAAAVEKVLPHTLRIRVTEREPIAQFVFPRLRAGGGYERGNYHLDAQGYVMVPLLPQQLSTPPGTNDHLPIILGIPPSDLRPGRQAESFQVRAALRLIVDFGQSPMAGLVELHQIDLTAPDILQVTTDQNGEVTFGLHDLPKQLLRWRAIHNYGQRTGKHLASLDLSVSNNVPVRWLQAGLWPPFTPKEPKTSSDKKKNV